MGENGITRIIFPGAPTYPDDTPRLRHAFGVVYANEIALADLTATPRETFKPGAIIVREKLSRTDSTKPQLLAVMIKREPGFNPAAADWDFLILNGAGTRIRKRERPPLTAFQTQPDRSWPPFGRRNGNRNCSRPR